MATQSSPRSCQKKPTMFVGTCLARSILHSMSMSTMRDGPKSFPQLSMLELTSSIIDLGLKLRRSGAVERTLFADIFRRDAEGRTDRDGGNHYPGFAGHDVPRRSRRSAQCARAYFRQDAETFHSHCAGGQGVGGAFAVRSDQGANHLSRAVRSTRLRQSYGGLAFGVEFAQNRKRT